MPELSPNEVLLLDSKCLSRIVGTQVKVVDVLKANEDGDCFYLGDKGCTIYDKRPEACKQFDCRELYKSIGERVFINVLVRGKELLENQVKWADPVIK